mmetsp:Transcript_73973/g.209491  ORF Transcript_73973/g.209491 Transcript_73973/m.209491 type:complete len:250 (-) Transcript_73973:796-1545(-)
MRSWDSLCSSSSALRRSASALLMRALIALWFVSILPCISPWISACLWVVMSSSRAWAACSSNFLVTCVAVSSIVRTTFSWLVSTLSSSCFISLRIWLSASSTFLRRLSTSRRRAEAMSLTVFTEASMSSFMSFQEATSTFVSSFACIWSRSSARSSESWWQRSCASCRLCETSSIHASCALSASCMSPMSRRIVEISAVTVASTRCLEVMMEWVESTLARISSRSTFTASMAAVKSSMSRSQASTMRFT